MRAAAATGEFSDRAVHSFAPRHFNAIDLMAHESFQRSSANLGPCVSGWRIGNRTRARRLGAIT